MSGEFCFSAASPDGSSPDSSPEEKRFSFTARFAPGAEIMVEVSSLCDALSGHWRESGLPAAAEFPFCIALEELLTNEAKYGSVAEGTETIVVEGRVGADDPAHPALLLRDNCLPYDPRDEPPPVLEGDVAERPIGGLGLHMVFQMFELRRYVYENGGNAAEWVWKG